MRGVINLRGKIIPVLDLRVKFGMPSVENTEETCIIVVEVHKNDDSVEMGILVDKVSEVLDIKSEDIEDAPSFGSGFDVSFILGMAKAEDSVKILLNIDAVLQGDEVIQMNAASASASATAEEQPAAEQPVPAEV